jgi:maleate cis-trans isomerase
MCLYQSPHGKEKMRGGMGEGEYGRAGLLGMLTPQANTTVEPEFWVLLPPGWSMLNARLTSGAPSIQERLVDYADRFVATAAAFANAPLTALAVGCTGASYLVGRAREAAILEELGARHGVPCHTAGTATVAALRALGARRIALVSPYPGRLDAACGPYWESFGLEVVARTGPDLRSDRFHPIYAMRGAAVAEAMERLRDCGADAVVMLGTGMATLGPLLAARRWAEEPGAPVPLSCNLALAWAATRAGEGREPDRASLLRWVGGAHWEPRRRLLFPEPTATPAA